MAAGLGFKNFTSGEVLTAADVNAYLNSQTVMVFASAAARTSAITSPQEGMFSFLKDTNTTQYYTGSAWVDLVAAGGAPGLTFIASASPSAAASQSFNNCFSSTYQNYFIVMNLLNSVGEDPLLFRMRLSGTDASGSDYDYIQEFVYSTSQLVAATNNATSARASIVANGVQSAIVININRPFDAAPTLLLSNASWYNGNDSMRKIGVAAVHNVSTSYDGITFLTTGGTMTGTIRIYGYSNS
jgi:hypothetical protein